MDPLGKLGTCISTTGPSRSRLWLVVIHRPKQVKTSLSGIFQLPDAVAKLGVWSMEPERDPFIPLGWWLSKSAKTQFHVRGVDLRQLPEQ